MYSVSCYIASQGTRKDPNTPQKRDLPVSVTNKKHPSCASPVGTHRHVRNSLKKKSLLSKPLPCSPAAETAIQPLIRCSES